MPPRKVKSKATSQAQAQVDAQPSAENSTNRDNAPPIKSSSVDTHGSSQTRLTTDKETQPPASIDFVPPTSSSTLLAATSTTGSVSRPAVKRNPIRGGRASTRTTGPSENKPRPLKFQPKANVIRRSKEERETQDRAEEERRRARLRANAPESSYRGRFRDRGRGGRGGFRGGMSGWRDQKQLLRKATEPLGGIPTYSSSVSNRGNGSLGVTMEFSYPGDFNEEQSVKAEKSSFSKPGTIIKNEYHNVSKEDDDIGPCIDIEQINLITDDEESEEDPIRSNGKGREKGPKAPGWIIRPIRLERYEHAERETKVSTDPSSTISAELRRKQESEKDKEDLTSTEASEGTRKGQGKAEPNLKDPKDFVVVKEERPWKGVYSDTEDQDVIVVKTEPGHEEDVMMVDLVDAIIVASETPSEKPADDPSTTGRLRTQEPAITEAFNEKVSTQKALLPTSNLLSHDVAQINEEVTHKTKGKSRVGFNLGPRRPILQTPEDQGEWERYRNNVIAVSEELGSTPVLLQSISATKDQEGDVQMEESKAEVGEDMKDRREGMVYLMQLPPIMPNLISEEKIQAIREAKKAQKAWDIKQEKTKKEKMKAKVNIQKDKVGTTKAVPEVKSEPLPEKASGISMLHTALRPGDDIESTGDVGTLKVYQSGKVILEWGGIKFYVGMGAPGDILQEAVIMNNSSVKQEDEAMEVDTVSTATGLGQIGGGFSATPHWPSML